MNPVPTWTRALFRLLTLDGPYANYQWDSASAQLTVSAAATAGTAASATAYATASAAAETSV